MKVSDTYVGRVLVEDVPKGAYVRAIRAGEPTKKVYLMEGYCRFNRAYQLDDFSDISRSIYLRKGKWVEMINY